MNRNKGIKRISNTLFLLSQGLNLTDIVSMRSCTSENYKTCMHSQFNVCELTNDFRHDHCIGLKSFANARNIYNFRFTMTQWLNNIKKKLPKSNKKMSQYSFPGDWFGEEPYDMLLNAILLRIWFRLQSLNHGTRNFTIWSSSIKRILRYKIKHKFV